MSRAAAAEAIPEDCCRVCGCSHFNPCETPHGPCGWAELDLCSACAGTRAVIWRDALEELVGVAATYLESLEAWELSETSSGVRLRNVNLLWKAKNDLRWLLRFAALRSQRLLDETRFADVDEPPSTLRSNR